MRRLQQRVDDRERARDRHGVFRAAGERQVVPQENANGV
jgi:hypothetical protein